MPFPYTKPSKDGHWGQAARTALWELLQSGPGIDFNSIWPQLCGIWHVRKIPGFIRFFTRICFSVQRQRVNKSSCHCCWQPSPAKDVFDSKRHFCSGPFSLRKIIFKSKPKDWRSDCKRVVSLIVNRFWERSIYMGWVRLSFWPQNQTLNFFKTSDASSHVTAYIKKSF